RAGPDRARGSVNQLPYFLAAWLFFVGLYGMVTTRNFLHLVMCLGVLQASTYVLLLEVGYRAGGTAPIFKDFPRGTRAVDSVVQALTLTDVVACVTVSALLMALALQSHWRCGSL